MAVFIKGKITVHPNSKIGYNFRFHPPTSQYADDGNIPYGRTVSSIVVSVYSSDGTAVTTQMVEGTPTISGEYLTIILKYPSNGDGKYLIHMLVTLDNGQTDDAFFLNLYAKDIIGSL